MEILQTVISISLISVGLAVIIMVAELFLNNYGECKIDINNGEREHIVNGGNYLLSSLAENKIFIPSACGGKATCGMCKVRVIEGGGTVLPTEIPYLTPEEIEQNVRLSCQVKIKNDIKIVIPEELFNVREYLTTLTSMTDETHDIKRLRLSFKEGEEITFKAGQYMQLYSKPYAKVKESVYRAYSIASAPSEKKHVDLIVRLVPQGICTTYVHTALKVNDQVKVSGPFGEFYLRGKEKELVMIAGGSGLAPIRSIILDVLEKQLDYKMTFFFGAVTKKDLYNLDEMYELAEKHENFRFVPALSKPEPSDAWTGELGLITEVVNRFIPDGEGKEAYLCGSPGMINACLAVLDNKGIPPEKIFFDKF